MQNRLREIRKNLKLSQEKLAEICGISRVQVTRLETGRRKLSMENAARYSERLNTKFPDLNLTPIEFFYDLKDIGVENDREKELLKTFRGLSEKDQTKYLKMGQKFHDDT